MANRPPDYSGGFGYGPWPETDKPFEKPPGGEYIGDGYANRSPGGCHTQTGTDYWLDCIVYPERTYADGTLLADTLDARSRDFRVSIGQLTGRKVGPAE